MPVDVNIVDQMVRERLKEELAIELTFPTIKPLENVARAIVSIVSNII